MFFTLKLRIDSKPLDGPSAKEQQKDSVGRAKDRYSQQYRVNRDLLPVLLRGVKCIVDLQLGDNQAHDDADDPHKPGAAVGNTVPKRAVVHQIATALSPKKPPEVIAVFASCGGWILLSCWNGIVCDLRRLLGKRTNLG
ncbi:MAG: hypothetical protein ACLP9L_14885 [Thermoguttaceae bacterium]